MSSLFQPWAAKEVGKFQELSVDPKVIGLELVMGPFAQKHVSAGA